MRLTNICRNESLTNLINILQINNLLDIMKTKRARFICDFDLKSPSNMGIMTYSHSKVPNGAYHEPVITISDEI